MVCKAICEHVQNTVHKRTIPVTRRDSGWLQNRGHRCGTHEPCCCGKRRSGQERSGEQALSQEASTLCGGSRAFRVVALRNRLTGHGFSAASASACSLLQDGRDAGPAHAPGLGDRSPLCVCGVVCDGLHHDTAAARSAAHQPFVCGAAHGPAARDRPEHDLHAATHRRERHDDGRKSQAQLKPPR